MRAFGIVLAGVVSIGCASPPPPHTPIEYVSIDTCAVHVCPPEMPETAISDDPPPLRRLAYDDTLVLGGRTMFDTPLVGNSLEPSGFASSSRAIATSTHARGYGHSLAHPSVAGGGSHSAAHPSVGGHFGHVGVGHVSGGHSFGGGHRGGGRGGGRR